MIYLWLSLLFAPLLRLLVGAGVNPPRRVLVVQVAKIGDLVCSTPVFRELKSRHPQVQLHALVTSVNRPLLLASPHVDEVVTVDPTSFHGFMGRWRLRGLLRRGRYDAIVCLNVSTVLAVAALWAGIPRRLAVTSSFGGRSYRLAARLWTDTEMHLGDRLIQETYLSLLGRLGVSGGSVRKEVYAVPGSDEAVQRLLDGVSGPLFGIGVSSANRLKALGGNTITAIARALLEEVPEAHVVLIGAPEDRAEAETIRAALRAGAVIEACGRLSLGELPKLLAELDLFIGVDSGITYMADALDIPLVSVAGPCNMLETRPVGNHAVILQRDDLVCLPCAHIFRAPYSCHLDTRACITGIDATRIAETALALWRETGGRER